jgi:antitoxin ParD1/3/4
MTTINVSVSDTLREFIDAQVVEGKFASPDEFIRQLLEQLQKEKAREKVDLLLLEGLKSPVREMTRAEWDAIRQRLRHRVPQG